MSNRCYFCGFSTTGKTFEAKKETGEIKYYPVCDECDGADLHVSEPDDLLKED